MSKSAIEYLRHIRDECLFIQKTTLTMTESGFSENQVISRAVIRSLEIIGEAVKQLTKHQKQLPENVDWDSFARLRDILIHRYFGVNIHLIWDIVRNEIPSILKAVSGLLK